MLLRFSATEQKRLDTLITKNNILPMGDPTAYFLSFFSEQFPLRLAPLGIQSDLEEQLEHQISAYEALPPRVDQLERVPRWVVPALDTFYHPFHNAPFSAVFKPYLH